MRCVYTVRSAEPRREAIRRRKLQGGNALLGAVLSLLPLLAVGVATLDDSDRSVANSGSVPLLADCSNPEEVVANVPNTDRVQVRYGMGGGSQTCYAVSATVNGKKVDGYLLGAAHPDIAAFERDARSRVPEIPAPAPNAPAAQDSKTPAPAPVSIKSFAGLSGPSPDGHQVSVNALKTPTVVLYFWSAKNQQSIREASGMDGLFERYHGKTVGLIGVVSGASAARVRQVLHEEEVVWPQILDDGAIAARYPETQRTRYYILDRDRNVVAALKSASEVQRELTQLEHVKPRNQTGDAQ